MTGPPRSAEERDEKQEKSPPFYRPDEPFRGYEKEIGDPGAYPFTRGIHAEMYRRRLWTMRQYAGFAGASESNRRYRYLLSQGTTGLSVAFDLPTQIGLDSDHPLAEGEVGRVGVAIDSIQDMRRLFDRIPLDQVSTSMTINSTAAILLALYLTVAEEQSVPFDQVRGTVQNDVLKEYIARGTYIYPPEQSIRLTTDVIAFCSRKVPQWNPISISGYHIREAGATASQEIAFTIADAVVYVEAALEAGLKIDEFAPQLSFFFNAHNDLFEETAKFRAARRVWAELMRETYGARNPRSWKLRFHAQTAGSTLTARQPENNVVRVTVQAMAAILGGAQSLHTNSRDEALALPSEEAARIALRTQQILASESGIAETADPLGGSWLVESLTDELERSARDYLSRIADLGGMMTAIESGFVQREIQNAAYLQQRALEEGQQVVVGVNRFQEDEDSSIPLLKMDPAVEEKQTARLARLRQTREQAQVSEALKEVRAVARTQENLFPSIFRAVKVLATVGEISDALRDVFGEYQEKVVI